MRLNELVKGARTSRKRVGRGAGSGLGKTSGRGHKGQKARSGGYHKVGFEGGQMPIQRRLPKRGFVSRNRLQFSILNVGDLDSNDQLKADTLVTPELLLEKRVLSDLQCGLKILGFGNVSRAVEIHAHRISESAKQKIEAAGGKVVLL